MPATTIKPDIKIWCDKCQVAVELETKNIRWMHGLANRPYCDDYILLAKHHGDFETHMIPGDELLNFGEPFVVCFIGG